MKVQKKFICENNLSAKTIAKVINKIKSVDPRSPRIATTSGEKLIVNFSIIPTQNLQTVINICKLLQEDMDIPQSTSTATEVLKQTDTNARQSA